MIARMKRGQMMRENGFDTVKGAAILLVVFGHVWLGLRGAGLIADGALFTTVEAAIYLFHMPVFFFVSGVFFSARSAPADFARQKLLTLLWPLLLWSWVEGTALWLSGQGADRGLTGPLEVLAYPVPVKSVFWFLWALFVLQGITYAVQRLVPSAARLVLLALALGAVGVFLLRVDPGRAVTILENAPYFLAGVLMMPLRRALIAPRPLAILVALALFVLAQALRLRDGGDAPWFQLTALLAVLGFTSALGRVGATGAGRALAWLGQRTMPVYLVHIILTAGARAVLLKLGVTALGPHLIVGTLAGVAVPLALDAVVQRLRLGQIVGFGQRPPSQS